jgi:hypothetical protein
LICCKVWKTHVALTIFFINTNYETSIIEYVAYLYFNDNAHEIMVHMLMSCSYDAQMQGKHLGWTLSNLSIYVVFVDPHEGINDVMPICSTTKAYVELIGVEKT